MQAFVGVIAAAGIVLAGAVGVQAAPTAEAALGASTATVDSVGSDVVKTGLAGFNASNLIADAVFFQDNAMSAAQIQNFLDSKIGTCSNGKCINVANASFSNRGAVVSERTGNLVCKALRGGTMKVSEAIFRVQQACGISAKVILVTLQKEQGLVTSRAPSDWNIRSAMGAFCPDSAPCDPAYAGIGPQLVSGTTQLKTYSAGRFARQPGNHVIGYHPNTSCGAKTLNIANYATAALYNYTPYQPNAAALRAGYGTGDTCSSYGNRNFYNYFTDWFGTTQSNNPCAGPATSTVAPAEGEFTVVPSAMYVRQAPTDACATGVTVFKKGTVVTRLGVFGDWMRVRLNHKIYWMQSGYLTATPPITYTTARIQGSTRFDTAAQLSREAYPNGASTLFIAAGTNFPDALTAGAAARKNGASMLLASARGLTDATKAEAVRLKPTRVVIIGGTAVLPATIDRDLKALLPAATIERVAGTSRYDTSNVIARTLVGTAATAYIATGFNFPDALSASAVAGAQNMPVLLVDGRRSTVEASTIDTLRAMGVRNVNIVGGTAVVPQGVADALTAAGFVVTRYGGGNRYQTSVMVNQGLYGGDVVNAYLATGTAFPDAVSGAVLASVKQAPLLLQFPWCMPSDSKDYLIARGVDRATLIGGPAALTEEVAASSRC